jgi:hypothetical protein
MILSKTPRSRQRLGLADSDVKYSAMQASEVATTGGKGCAGMD